jgi:hypothetical protein
MYRDTRNARLAPNVADAETNAVPFNGPAGCTTQAGQAHCCVLLPLLPLHMKPLLHPVWYVDAAAPAGVHMLVVCTCTGV